MNVEFVERVAPGHVRMRVHERGVGETRSCGTGACAVAWVEAGDQTGSFQVDVPGGTVWVDIEPDGPLVLRGPAGLVVAARCSGPAACRRAVEVSQRSRRSRRSQRS